MLSKHYKLIEVNYRTWLFVPLGTYGPPEVTLTKAIPSFFFVKRQVWRLKPTYLSGKNKRANEQLKYDKLIYMHSRSWFY